MQTESHEKQLNVCLTKIISLVEERLKNLKSYQEQPATGSTDDNLLQNSQLNNNVYTFTLHEEENELLDILTCDIQTILNEHLPHLSSICLKYLSDFLYTYQYDRKQQKFTTSLATGTLHSFQRELQGLLASLEAFPAAFNGRLDVVKRFIEAYPTFKDQPGLWETTLLYSAARNNHFNIVKYLVEEAHCSVNAQNQLDVVFALDAHATNYAPRPTAASTALHGACFNNHLNIVKYLVEHDADYFIKNQAHETPMMNGERHSDIKSYFQDYLILSYSAAIPEILPIQSIMNDTQRPIKDCMWEYKPFQDPKWYKFSVKEATLLHKALLPSEEFQQQVYLRVTKGLYSVSMIEFVRSGRHEQDPKNNRAWIRCRGSSILNFDCYSIWQIMLIQHQKVHENADQTSSLEVQQFPDSFNSHFQLQLNTWYNCDIKTSSLLDNSMNYRRKITSINIPYVGDNLNFNLQTFEFSNNEKTILGYVRWIPKFISSTDKDTRKIVYVDNYQSMANSQPIPLTTTYLQETSQVKSVNSQQINDIDDDVDENDCGFQSATISGIESDGGADDNDIEHWNDKNQVS